MQYKEAADKIFMNNQLQKQDVIKGQSFIKVEETKRAQNLIKERLDIFKNKLYRLDEFTALLENLNSLNNENPTIRINLLEEIKAEICHEFNIKLKNKRDQKNRLICIRVTPNSELNTPRGLKVQIGRNMRQNDLISFKFSKKGSLVPCTRISWKSCCLKVLNAKAIR